MAADAPTILATSGGLRRGARIEVELGPLIRHALELSGTQGRTPRLCHVGTALGDQRAVNAAFDEAGRAAGVIVSHLNLFPMPNIADIGAHLLDQDAIWVGGGSVANLLALWRLHGVDEAMEAAWRARVVLAGVSAGSICWHVGGTTDSFGPDLRPVTDGLGLLPHSNGVHYDAEVQRRPLYHQLVSRGVLPAGYATDNGVGLVYRHDQLVEVVAETVGKAAYSVRPNNTPPAGAAGPGGARDVTVGVVEERIEPRLLPMAS